MIFLRVIFLRVIFLRVILLRVISLGVCVALDLQIPSKKLQKDPQTKPKRPFGVDFADFMVVSLGVCEFIY